MIGSIRRPTQLHSIALAHADQSHVRSHAAPFDTEIEGNLCRLRDGYAGEG